jgi:hypothetical protein
MLKKYIDFAAVKWLWCVLVKDGMGWEDWFGHSKDMFLTRNSHQTLT